VLNASPAPGSSPHPPCGELQRLCDSNSNTRATLTTRPFTGTHTAQISSKKNYATTTLTPTLPLSLNSSNPNVIALLLAPILLLNVQTSLPRILLLHIPLYLIHTINQVLSQATDYPLTDCTNNRESYPNESTPTNKHNDNK
jgi:hypothetical protein